MIQTTLRWLVGLGNWLNGTATPSAGLGQGRELHPQDFQQAQDPLLY